MYRSNGVLFLASLLSFSWSASAHHSFAVHYDGEKLVCAEYMAWSKRPGDYVLPYDCDPNYGG